MAIDIELRLQKLVGERGLLPIRDSTGFRGEVAFTVLAVEPAETLDDDFEKAINRGRFTVRYDQGTSIDGKEIGVYLGSAFSKLTGY